MSFRGAVWIIALNLPAFGERLPLRLYTTSDGLPSSYVEKIVPDSNGLLWFCTRDGLSRFDGSRFVTYSVAHGLPIPHVNHLVEAHDGSYWVATNGGGVSRFDPQGRVQSGKRSNTTPRLFTTFRVGDQPLTNRVNVLYQDRRQRLWAGTDGGLFRLHEDGGRTEFRPFPSPLLVGTTVKAFAEDPGGNLWVVTDACLAQIALDDRVMQQHRTPARPSALLFDRQGSLWIGSEADGLVRLGPDGQRIVYRTGDGLASNQVTALALSRDGRIWVGGHGLAEFDGKRFRSFTREHGLSMVRRRSMALDQSGNLWFSILEGVVKLTVNGFTTYEALDGVGRVDSIFEDREGALIAAGIGEAGRITIHRFDGSRFRSVRPQLPPDAQVVWPGQGALLDRVGGWWLLTGKGLWRFPAVRHEDLAHIRASAIYDRRRGLFRDRVSTMYEDRAGDLWIGSLSGQEGALTRWERKHDRFRTYSAGDGLSQSANTPASFAEDPSGRLWIGFQFGGLARSDGDRFKLFTPADGLIQGGVTDLHVDSSGRLWIATNQSGIARLDDLGADRPNFVRYSSAEGLSSNNVRCIVEDSFGRIYLGTVRGVDRLDPKTGRIRRYTMGDGLASDFVTTAFRDRRGMLWFGAMAGLSRLEPRQDEAVQPPPVWIDGIRVAGVPHPVSEIGDRRIPDLYLDARSNNVEIDFFGLSYGVGEALRFQFMLDGADKDWSQPVEQRTVHYASLAPGSYRFMVRAVSADGVHSPSPAVVAFNIPPPFWQRWWFFLAGVLLTVSVFYSFHLLRVKRLLEIEALRRRIAADLHDDIGASLSRLAILSEVVKQQLESSRHDPKTRLLEIAETSRGLVDSMSEIVWSVDPRRDDLNNVALRVRQFASDVLGGSSIEWQFHAPEGLQKVKLDPEQRRQLFLIFKEALTNIVRHSASKSVSIALRAQSGRICAEICDDGRGFDPADIERYGHGLENMRSRAALIGGKIEVDSAPERGTRIVVDIPQRRFT